MISKSPDIIKKSFNAACVGVILNVLLSAIAMPYATKVQITPPNGAANLPFFSQIMHMLVHHKQVILTSSLIVFALVFISTYVSLSIDN